MVLLGVLLVGRSAMGARRWIAVGPLSLQPSELFKLAFIGTLAVYLASRESSRPGLDRLIVPLALTFPAIALIVKQPDLGTALTLLPVAVALIIVGGARWRHLGMLAGCGLAVLPVFWFLLRDYQRERILVFIDPSRDPLGSAWNVIQAKITIGSGQLGGKGLFGGTQSRLAFLPERHTDFVFAAYAESWGFLGAVALLIVYALLVLRGFEVAATARDTLGTLARDRGHRAPGLPGSREPGNGHGASAGGGNSPPLRQLRRLGPPDGGRRRRPDCQRADASLRLSHAVLSSSGPSRGTGAQARPGAPRAPGTRTVPEASGPSRT